MTDEDILDMLHREEAVPFTGWDFSHLDGRREEEAPAWDLAAEVAGAARGAASLLDVDTGDGRRLAALVRAMPTLRRVVATEAHPPNVALAAARLEPLGVEVLECRAGRIPCPDACIDVVHNRHGLLDARETRRILRPGGVLVTEQVGDQANLDLRRLLTGGPLRRAPSNLAHARGELEAAGLIVERAEECFPETTFHDAGAVVYYLEAIPWELPGFSVDRYAGPLLALQRRIERAGPLPVRFHLFLVTARKPGRAAR